jgi:hypothetical protein
MAVQFGMRAEHRSVAYIPYASIEAQGNARNVRQVTVP